jgi:hypothetical protein
MSLAEGSAPWLPGLREAGGLSLRSERIAARAALRSELNAVRAAIGFCSALTCQPVICDHHSFGLRRLL